MTLLSVAQAVAREIPVAVPTAVINSSDETAVRLLSAVRQASRSLYRAHPWVVLQREHTFTTANGTATYSLPTDFGRILDGTVWDRDNYRMLRGPLSSQEWQVYKSSVLGSGIGIHKRFQFRYSSGVKFTIDPTPSNSTDDLVYEYVSSKWCASSGGTAQTDWAADTDVLLTDANAQFSEELLQLGALWRALDRLGMDYTEAKAEYEAELGMAISRDGGAPTLTMLKRPMFSLVGPWSVPDSGLGS